MTNQELKIEQLEYQNKSLRGEIDQKDKEIQRLREMNRSLRDDLQYHLKNAHPF